MRQGGVFDFVRTIRGQSQLIPPKSFLHAAFPLVFACRGGGGGSRVASSSSSSCFSSRLKTLGSCSSLIRLHSAFNLLGSSEVILRAFHKSPASGHDSVFVRGGQLVYVLRQRPRWVAAACCLMPP